MIDCRKATAIVGSVVTIGSSLVLGCAGAFSVWVGLTFTSTWLPVVWGLVMLVVALVLLGLGVTPQPESRHLWIVYALGSLAFVIVGVQSASDWYSLKRWIGLVAIAVGLWFGLLEFNLWRRKSARKRPRAEAK